MECRRSGQRSCPANRRPRKEPFGKRPFGDAFADGVARRRDGGAAAPWSVWICPSEWQPLNGFLRMVGRPRGSHIGCDCSGSSESASSCGPIRLLPKLESSHEACDRGGHWGGGGGLPPSSPMRNQRRLTARRPHPSITRQPSQATTRSSDRFLSQVGEGRPETERERFPAALIERLVFVGEYRDDLCDGPVCHRSTMPEQLRFRGNRRLTLNRARLFIRLGALLRRGDAGVEQP